MSTKSKISVKLEHAKQYFAYISYQLILSENTRLKQSSRAVMYDSTIQSSCQIINVRVPQT